MIVNLFIPQRSKTNSFYPVMRRFFVIRGGVHSHLIMNLLSGPSLKAICHVLSASRVSKKSIKLLERVPSA